VDFSRISHGFPAEFLPVICTPTRFFSTVTFFLFVCSQSYFRSFQPGSILIYYSFVILVVFIYYLLKKEMSKSYVIGNVVTLDYNDLVAGKDLSAQIAEAYGFDGIGVLTVKNVPQFIEARERLLPLARQFALLPEETKTKYVHEESHYSFGWSHGKEKLQGNFDLSKGSYYANPQFDEPIANPELIKKLSSFVHPNIWPSAQDCPDFEAAFKTLGRIMVEVGVLVAKQCDTFVHSNCSAYPSNKLETIIRESLNCKARLLHYFADAVNEDQNTSVDDFASWCGWHNDHGSLTGLTSALFVEEKTGRIIENTDPNAGKRDLSFFSFFL
jgi:hypothetical protein